MQPDPPSAPRSCPAVRIEGLRLERRGLLLIDDLDLAMDTGETVAVMGPSGAGKSSLLRVLAGLMPCTAGRVRVDAERTAMVFQDPRLLPWRTAIDNIAIALPEGRRAERRARAADWLDRVGLADAHHLYPAAMSGGMRQRVSIARALATEPDLVLVDEPFASLDHALADQLRGVLLGQLDDRSRTVVWVTHDPREASAVSTRTLFLDGPPAGRWRVRVAPSPTLSLENLPCAHH